MNTAPDISFVVASRNDDHGGNLTHRMQVFVEALIEQCDRHELNAELVLVEWNPPVDRPRLAEIIKWPNSKYCKIRIIEVPHEIHLQFDSAESLPLHQMIAKNAGIIRARGTFIVATNIDIIFSDKLISFLASGRLDPNGWYRVDRYDVGPDVPEGADMKEKLIYCEKNILRIHKREGSADLTDNTYSRIYHSPAILRLLRLLAPFSFLPGLGKLLNNSMASLKFIDQCGKLHTNASGDFTMMAREQWIRLEGYWEFPGFPINIDGILCYSANFSGMKEHVLSPPAVIYHIEHGKMSGFKSYRSGKKWKSLAAAGIPRISPDEYMNIVFDLRNGRRKIPMNEGNWGLGNNNLAEIYPSRASSNHAT